MTKHLALVAILLAVALVGCNSPAHEAAHQVAVEDEAAKIRRDREDVLAKFRDCMANAKNDSDRQVCLDHGVRTK